MIEIRKETNYLMDWDDPKDRINYFRNLRMFLSEIALVCETHEFCALNDDDDKCTFSPKNIIDIFKKWNVYFIDADEIPRVNLDGPR